MPAKSTAVASPDPTVIAALAAVSEEELAKYMARFAEGDAKPVKSAKGATNAKVAKVRNLDPETLEHEGFTIVITPTSKSGLWRGGSRVQVKGKSGMALRSLDTAALSVLVDNADAITDAIETVDKRALVGPYLPADERKTEAKS